jgi:hypothetical protein
MVYYRVNATVLLFSSCSFSSGKFLLQFCLFTYILPYLYFIYFVKRCLYFHPNEEHVFVVLLTATCLEITETIMHIYRNNLGKNTEFERKLFTAGPSGRAV